MSSQDQHENKRKLPPGRYGLPIIGETVEWRRDPLKFLHKRYNKYGRIFRSATYGNKEIVMLGPEANEFILSSHRDHFEWRAGQQHFFHPRLFGENLFVLDGEEHDRKLQLMLPAFHGKAVQSYFRVMHEMTQAYARRWAQASQITVFPEMRRLTFDIAARLLMGAHTGQETAYLSKLFDDLARGIQAFPKWNLPWLRFARALRAAEKLQAYFREILHQRRENPGNDVLGMLLQATDEAENHLSDEEIITHSITLVEAAHDTTTSSLTWLVYELARHPKIRDKIRAELAEVTKGQQWGVEHISRLGYLDLVVKEVERRHPVVTGAPRKVVKGFEFDGYYVPAGSFVFYSILFTHLMPEVFSQPMQFDPERFAEPRNQARSTPYGLIGFGGGARPCLGRGFARMEIKTIATLMLEGYEWEILPGQNLEPTYTPTRRPKDGLRITLRSRL